VYKQDLFDQSFIISVPSEEEEGEQSGSRQAKGSSGLTEPN